ncbi:MAG: hypothetical protein JW807_13740 [Spirochaetes bacterium]|nr:hypothetical protein [Spirochaetota bacterium]
MIETTLYLRNYQRTRLLEAVVTTGQPRGRIISALMKKIAGDHGKLIRSWSRVKYQDRSGEKGREFHVTLKPDEYEFFQDLRKFFKRSVSGLVADAVDKYLDEVIEEITKETDNYWYSNYALSSIIIDGVVCWILYWGIPKKLLTNPRYSVDFCPSGPG